MTATLADLGELTRSLSAFAAFQGHFVSTFAAINVLLGFSPIHYPTEVAHSQPFTFLKCLFHNC
jgi:hypothetical protein